MEDALVEAIRDGLTRIPSEADYPALLSTEDAWSIMETAMKSRVSNGAKQSSSSSSSSGEEQMDPHLLFVAIAGSRAFHLDLPGSDSDMFAVFITPSPLILSLKKQKLSMDRSAFFFFPSLSFSSSLTCLVSW